jgi:hypothetical protein
MHIVIAEAKRRIESGEVTPKRNECAKFSEVLATWWETERHKYDPTLPSLKPRSIKNKILDELWNPALNDALN